MAYADDYPIAEIPCVLRVWTHFVATPDEPPREMFDRPMRDYVPATAFAIEATTTRLLGGGERARHAVRAFIHACSDAPREEDDDAAPASASVEELLWEFFDEVGFHDGFVVYSVTASLSRAIEGGVAPPFQLGFWSPRSGPFPTVTLECVAVEFLSGSLVGKLTTVAKGTAAILTLVFAAAATPPAIHAYERLRVTQEITAVYGDERCMMTTGFDIDGGALLNATAREMNYKADGLPAVERARRVCLVQLALTTNRYAAGPIDGIAGRRTEREVSAFVRDRHLHGDVTEQEVARELARALHAGARALVTK